VLRELVPDEAKLLMAMVGDTGRAMIHINIGRQRVLSYVTSAARAANIKSKDLTESYIAHLVAVGLVEVGPEDRSIPMEYELLEGESVVRDALAGTQGPRLVGRPHLERGTIRLTALGQALWAAYSGEVSAGTGPTPTPEEAT
jgi:hypothetical protein